MILRRKCFFAAFFLASKWSFTAMVEIEVFEKVGFHPVRLPTEVTANIEFRVVSLPLMTIQFLD
jgi:hypothetical protein